MLVLSLFLNATPASRAAPTTLPSVTLGWNRSTDPTVTGYNIYYGGKSGAYTNMIKAGNVTNAMIFGLTGGATYYFAATAYNAAGVQSGYSSEASTVVAASPLTRKNDLAPASPLALKATSKSASPLALQVHSLAEPSFTLQISNAPAGQFMLTVAGPAGSTVDLLATQDFQDWTVIGTVTVSDDGSLNFTDTNAPDFPQRFYRTRETP